MKRGTTALQSLIALLITVLFFQGCNDLPPIDNGAGSDISDDETHQNTKIADPSNTSDDEAPPASGILTFLDAYFSDKPSDAYRTPYIVVENYTDLCVIYEYVREYSSRSTEDKKSYILHINGNVHEARMNNSYPEEYFESGYVIAALTTDSSGSWSFECGATKNDGEIIVNLDGTLPAISTDDLGGFIYLVPMDGSYADESVKIVKTRTQETLPDFQLQN